MRKQQRGELPIRDDLTVYGLNRKRHLNLLSAVAVGVWISGSDFNSERSKPFVDRWNVGGVTGHDSGVLH